MGAFSKVFVDFSNIVQIFIHKVFDTLDDLKDVQLLKELILDLTLVHVVELKLSMKNNQEKTEFVKGFSHCIPILLFVETPLGQI